MSILVKNYSATHGKSEGGGGGKTIIMGGGSTNIPANLNVTSINARLGDIDELTSKSITTTDLNFVYLVGGDGTITKLRGGEIEHYAKGTIDELNSDLIKATEIKGVQSLEARNAWIDYLNSKQITTDFLTVTKQAHFFELIIDKVRSVGGTMIMTAANCVLDYTKPVDSNGNYLPKILVPNDPDDPDSPTHYEEDLENPSAAYFDVFWLANENGGKITTNDWIANDQAYCQSFNLDGEKGMQGPQGPNIYHNVNNKYYWRLVTAKLDDRYMNLNTGAELQLNEAQQATVNSVDISEPYIEYNGETSYTGWDAEPQLPTITSGVTWTAGPQGPQGQLSGTMTSTNNVFGIQLTVTNNVFMQYFGFDCSPARLNVGIYYVDGSSQYWAAPDTPQTTYRFATLDNVGIEAAVIINADEVEWKLVHGIRLSNVTGEFDGMLGPQGPQGQQGSLSVPSQGDNIAQLGYRYQNVSGYPTGGTEEQIISWINNNRDKYDRASAQILCAYKTPDIDVVPPAYAQYTGINDYSLRNHRGTYIDATGGYFKGKLVTTSGNFINITDDGLSVDVDFYKIIPDVNIITIDSDGIVNPSTLGVKFLHSGNSTLDSTVPVGCSFNYSIDGGTATTIPAGGTVNIFMPQSLTNNSYLTMNLFKDSDLVDNVRMTVTDIRVSAGSQGPQGPQGPTGPQGSSTTDYYTLMPINEMFEVRIGAENVGPQAYENIHGVLYANAKYGVMHVTGDTVSYLSENEINSLFELEVISNPTGANLTANNKYQQTGYGTAKINNDTTSTTTIGTIYFEDDNILETMYPNNPTYQDYYTLHWNNGIQRAPQELNIALIKKSDSSQMDHRTILLVFKASHLWSVTDTALNSIYHGLSGTQGKYTSTGFSHIKQTWDQIELTVSNVVRDNEGALEEDTDVDEYIYQRNNNSDIATSLPQNTAWDTTPTNWYDGEHYPTPDSTNQYVWKCHRSRTITLLNDGTISYGTPTSWTTPILYEKYGVNRVGVNSAQLALTAENINLSVKNDLRSTGINIEDGTITLDAEKTSINGNLNLKETTNGITLYDSNGDARVNISPNTTPIPTFGDDTFSSTNYASTKTGYIEKSTSAIISATTPKISIGQYSSGNTISMTITPFMYGESPGLGYYIENNPASITCEARLYIDSALTASYTQTETLSKSTSSSGINSYPSFDWDITNISSAGDYYFEMHIEASDNSNGYSKYYIGAKISYEKKVDSLTYLGLDGFLVGTTNNHFARINKDGYEFRWIGTQNNAYGGSAIRLNDNGLQRVYNFDINSGPISWVGIDCYTPATVLDYDDFESMTFYRGNTEVTAYAYIIKPNDSIIYMPNRNDVWILLGDGAGGRSPIYSMPGRKITIIKQYGVDVHIAVGYNEQGYGLCDDGGAPKDYIDARYITNIISTPSYRPVNGGYTCYWTLM